MAKGDIVHHKQYLLLPQCFQSESAVDASKRNCMLKRAKKKMFLADNPL